MQMLVPTLLSRNEHFPRLEGLPDSSRCSMPPFRVETLGFNYSYAREMEVGMKRKAKKLALHRETLLNLSLVRGAFEPTEYRTCQGCEEPTVGEDTNLWCIPLTLAPGCVTGGITCGC
jgi:hypothetical protein